MTHNLFPQKVKLTKDHEYIHENGDRYMGFSKFCDEALLKPFNKSGAAYGVAKSENITADEVIEKWDGQRDNGVRIDEALSRYFKDKTTLETDADIVDLIHSVANEYVSYKNIYNQVVVYNEDHKIAGSPDNFVLTSNRPDGQFEMSDFKSFEKDDLFEHKGWFLPPMQHLSNTKWMKIAFQLS